MTIPLFCRITSRIRLDTEGGRWRLQALGLSWMRSTSVTFSLCRWKWCSGCRGWKCSYQNWAAASRRGLGDWSSWLSLQVIPLGSSGDFVSLWAMVMTESWFVFTHSSCIIGCIFRSVKSFNDAVTEAKAVRSTGPSAGEIAKLPKWEMNRNECMHGGGVLRSQSKVNSSARRYPSYY